MPKLEGKVALVTGASRGVGRGVALGLAEAGARVYLSGRTLHEGDAELPGSLESTAEAVAQLGGEARAIQCDHSRDEQVEELFRRLEQESGQLDVHVNSVWGGYKQMETFALPFWEQPRWRWDDMFQAGVRAAYMASALAAASMVRAQSGLIVNISSWAARKYSGSVAYGAAKAATDKLTTDMAMELREHGVAVVSLYPGLVRTESVIQANFFDLSNSESPQFLGRAVAALAADPKLLDRSGEILVAAELALEYGFRDIDESQPRPLTLNDA